MSYEVLSPQDWAQREFGGVDLLDQRLNRRVMQIASAMAADPQASLPKQNKCWKKTKGAYRLFDHERVTFKSVLDSHWQQTRNRCLDHSLVLWDQDTTFLDYSEHPGTEDLGVVRRGKDEHGSGLFLHSVLGLGITPTGPAVLGLGYNKLWARSGEASNATPQQRSRQRRNKDRESLRWSESVQAIGSAPPGVRYLHVGDREGDIFDLYEQTQNLINVGFVIRLNHNRSASLGHDTPETKKERRGSGIKDLARQFATLGETTLWIGPKARRAGRWARLKVSAQAVTLWSPQIDRTARAVRCWCVRVWEPAAPAGEEPVEWMLLSSEPANDLADALRIATYYSYRWLIEEYHKCLKSGCRVEERQLEHADRLAPLIGMLSVVATRLLQMKNDARLTPQRPARQCVPKELVQTLSKLINIPMSKIGVRKFVHEVVKRGGFIGRKSDGEPGYLTLWRGWQELMLIHTGYQLATECGDMGNE